MNAVVDMVNVLGKRLRHRTWILAASVVFILFCINAALQPNLLTGGVLLSNLNSVLPLALIAVGQTYVILAGDIDLSAGAIVSLVNVMTVVVIDAAGGGVAGVVAGLVVGLVTGGCAGLLNGLLVAVLRLQAIVTTFATGILFSGLALWILPDAGKPVPGIYWKSYAGAWLGIPVIVWIALLILIWIAAFMRSRAHRHLMATGGMLRAAYQSGIRVVGLRVGGYVLCGVFGALAAFSLTGNTATGDPLIGQAFTLSSISAVVLGGTALSGGSGGALGSLFGAVILILVDNIIFFANLQFEYQNLVKGLIVLLALAGGVLVARR